MRIGLYFGSFNPIHVGHLILANTILQRGNFHQVWFVITPLSPHKTKDSMLSNHHRLALVKEATQNHENLRASDIEFKMQAPFYTVNTLAQLKETYPNYLFELIMGEDNLASLPKWYNHEIIVENYPIWVYPRVQALSDTSELAYKTHPNVHFLTDVPLMNISATYIRNAIKNNQSVDFLLTPEVEKYVSEMNFYK